ncbi:MarR family winged helix-turn-helix transcriptional regulator [Salipiger bermudensis]|uniref:MarR family winged helix-turn-helix transcriptional regulator n=1 Tax=Salipiger bermudensis TaxID=344736 RepID=UPI001CD5D439|nr:MarR family transcriptional regulator [Salipiger bermudensis]MCA0963036.1 MarR family transcriptional regulator [Salipiger bermudensis]
MHDSSASEAAEAKDSPLRSGPLDRSLGYRLRLAQILAYRNFEETHLDQGVAPRYLGLLSLVSANPGQPQNKLAEAVGLQKSSLVTILDRLEKDGILERGPIPEDRRAKGVWLTEKGGQVVEELSREAAAHEARMTEGLSETDRARLIEMLGVVIENLRA